MKIVTDHPIAVDSNDHMRPHGAIHDFSDATEFCEYVLDLWPEKKWLLDLGTGSGTVVKTAIEAGMINAFGIEGSDAPRKQGLGAWPELGDERLFNADLRYPFEIRPDHDTMDWIYEFDIITAWDVMEHMTEDTIDRVMENIRRHSKVGTFVMATIQFDNHNNELYHHLLKPREWWIKKFEEFGFKDKGPSPMLSMVRGVPKQCQFWFERIE